MTDSKVFEGVDFALLETQRLALSFLTAAADDEVKLQYIKMYAEELDGLQNFLDHITDVACDMYGEETVLPITTVVNAEMDRLDAEHEGTHPDTATKLSNN